MTARAAIEARVLVTERLRPLRVEGRTVHQMWLPYHWGGGGLVTGDSANDLFGITLDPNVLIQESKVGTCDIRAGPPAHRAGAAASSSRTTGRRAGISDDRTLARSSPRRPTRQDAIVAADETSDDDQEVQ